ncbi:MAG: hypothetical protein IID14_08490 [Candidatus Marinimicrobia bacterium]|nr:hypothetical protein [Candidatus Neomarinimicrobiota bacterium]
MKQFASSRFWTCYRRLPAAVRKLADKNFELLKAMPHHPSLHFKKIDKYRSVRVGLHYRALAVEVPEGLLWFWIGSHSDYDKLLG